MLDIEMTAAARLDAVSLDAIDERAGLPGLELFVPMFVVDHDDGRTVARAKALHRLNREHAGWIGLAGLDPQLLFELFDDALRSRERARQRVAHLQHVGADGVAEEHHVVRNHVLDIRRGTANHLADVTRRVGGNISLLLLHEIERVQDRGLAELGWVVGRELFEPPTVLGRVLKFRPFGQRLAL